MKTRKNVAGQELSCKNGAGQKKIKNRTGNNGAGQELSRVKIKSIFGGAEKQENEKKQKLN